MDNHLGIAELADKRLSPAELAERYDLPLDTVYGWNRTGSGPKYMKIGRHVRYRLADIVAWENSRIKIKQPA